LARVPEIASRNPKPTIIAINEAMLGRCKLAVNDAAIAVTTKPTPVIPST
jgi:hypothetical protein